MIRNLVALGMVFLISPAGHANAPTFDSLSDGDLETIVKEFSSNFVHTSVTPPTSLGKVFGVEAAMIVGLTESPGVKQISQSIDPQSDIEYLPHAWLLGGMSVPYGISIELNILPELDLQDIEMKHTSVGLKWSVTDQFLKNLPFDLAVRTYYTTSEIRFRQTVSNPGFPATSDVDVSFKNTMIGGDTLLGFDFSIVEPYVGIGFVSSEGRLAGAATTNTPYSLFDDLSSREKSTRQDSARLIAGAQFHLAVLNIGIEYTQVFSTNRLTAKLGLQF